MQLFSAILFGTGNCCGIQIPYDRHILGRQSSLLLGRKSLARRILYGTLSCHQPRTDLEKAAYGKPATSNRPAMKQSGTRSLVSHHLACPAHVCDGCHCLSLTDAINSPELQPVLFGGPQ
jgi:hypothetical protein